MPYKNKNKQKYYMKKYMRDYRKLERAILREARRKLGLSTKVKKPRKKRKK